MLRALSNPIKFAGTFTWATKPAAAVGNTGAIIRVSDVAGGAYFESTGTRWRPLSNVLTLYQNHVAVAGAADTNENTLRSFTLPGGLMGPNDGLLAILLGTHTSSANTKTWRVKIGTQAMVAAGLTTTAQISTAKYAFNRNVQNSQITGNAAAILGPGTSGTAVTTLAADTAVDNTVAVTVQKASAGETMQLESIMIQLIRATD
jgi:hypothetical protein